jgi:TPR repeat protein
VCPLEGCDAKHVQAIESAANPGACAAAGDAPCGGSPAAECTTRALAAWSEASDERALACVARMLAEACDLGDARACMHTGRLLLDGKGLPRDVTRGVGLLDRACVAGEVLACRVAVRWLADPEHAHAVTEGTEVRARLDRLLDCLTGEGAACTEVALDYSRGRDGYPRDLARSAEAYERGCTLDQKVACNNLGDAYEYGDGVRRDLPRAVELYDRACRGGEPLGCANLGHLIENGEGTPRDVPRARSLYRDACAAGDVYGCLHEAMSAVESPATPAEAQRALERWQRACDARSARACAFVGVLYEDGPDGYARDEDRSRWAMKRACDLGEPLGCAWVRSH